MTEVVHGGIEANSRRFQRVPFAGKVEYVSGANAVGTASCRDLGRGGVSVTLGRYLKPGRSVLMQVSSADQPIERAELKGLVVWCRPTASPDHFVAGIRVAYDIPAVSEVMSRLMLTAALAYSGNPVCEQAQQADSVLDVTAPKTWAAMGALVHAGLAKALAFALTALAA